MVPEAPPPATIGISFDVSILYSFASNCSHEIHADRHDRARR
jgi:hypothetical protein